MDMDEKRPSAGPSMADRAEQLVGRIGRNLGVVRCKAGSKACRNSADPSCDRSELNAALIRLSLRFTFTGNAVY